jgi:hypothetical protein
MHRGTPERYDGSGALRAPDWRLPGGGRWANSEAPPSQPIGDLGIDTLVTVGTTQGIAALAVGAFLSNQPPRSESADDPEGLLPLLNDLLTAGDVVFVNASRFVGSNTSETPSKLNGKRMRTRR